MNTATLDSLDDALAYIKKLEGKLYTPCHHCDFSSGMRGGDRCSHCDGTGRQSVIHLLKAYSDSDEKLYKETLVRANKLEAERDWLAKELVDRTKCLHGRYLGMPGDSGYSVFTSRAEAIASVLEWAGAAQEAAKSEGGA